MDCNEIQFMVLFVCILLIFQENGNVCVKSRAKCGRNIRKKVILWGIETMPGWIWLWKAAYFDGREFHPKGRRNG